MEARQWRWKQVKLGLIVEVMNAKTDECSTDYQTLNAFLPKVCLSVANVCSITNLLKSTILLYIALQRPAITSRLIISCRFFSQQTLWSSIPAELLSASMLLFQCNTFFSFPLPQLFPLSSFLVNPERFSSNVSFHLSSFLHLWTNLRLCILDQ